MFSKQCVQGHGGTNARGDYKAPERVPVVCYLTKTTGRENGAISLTAERISGPAMGEWASSWRLKKDIIVYSERNTKGL